MLLRAGLLLFSAGSVSLGGYFLYHNLDLSGFPIFRYSPNSSLRNTGESSFEEGTLGRKYPFLLLSTRAIGNESNWNKKQEKYKSKSDWNKDGFFKDMKTNDPYFVSKAKKGCAEAYKTQMPKSTNQPSSEPWDLMQSDSKWKEVLFVCTKFS